jgi:hypothetical protein
MVSRFVGAAVGVAIIGSVFAAAYASRSGSGDPPPTTGVLDAASRDAFADAVATGYVVIAVLAGLAAVVAWIALRRLARS